MTSGVYQITFPSGNRYIGKSVHIEERWKQHYDKMVKGKAAANMQAEWNKWQDWDAEILVECHPEHIDVVEACFIARNNPELNSDRPADPYPDLTKEHVELIFNMFRYSSYELIKLYSDSRNEAEKLEEEKLNLIKENRHLRKKRTKEELDYDVNNYFTELEENLDDAEEQIRDLKEEKRVLADKLAYYDRPWWKRIFD